MYKITNALDQTGFSINNIDSVLKRNNNSFLLQTFDFFAIYLAFEESDIIVEKSRFTIPKNHIGFIPPHKKIAFSERCKNNFVLAFNSSFYEKSVKDSFILNSELFFNKGVEIVIAPTIGDENALRNLIIKRLELYKEKDQNIYYAVAHNCIEILLLDGLLSFDSNSSDFVSTHSSYLETVNKFRVLLQKHYKTEKTVAFYSDILCVSPQRLSVMTKTIIGRGAKKLVVEKVASEALKLLQNSTLNISEIALELGFADEANFSTFVKKSLGKSPSDLRNDINFNKKSQF